MGRLRSLTPRQLEHLAERVGLEPVERETSSDLRQRIVAASRAVEGDGGTVTTSDLPPRRGEPTSDPAIGTPAHEAAGSGFQSPILDDALAAVADNDLHADVARGVAEAVLDALTVDDLSALAADHEVEVERETGDGAPLKDDYVNALTDAVVDRAGDEADPIASSEPSAADEEAAARAEAAAQAEQDVAAIDGEPTVKQLKEIAAKHGIEVTRADGTSGKPTRDDYLSTLTSVA